MYASLPWREYQHVGEKNLSLPCMSPALSMDLVLIQNFDSLFIMHFCTNFNFMRCHTSFIILDHWVFWSPLNIVPGALGTPFLVCITQGALVFVVSSLRDHELFESRDSISLFGCNRGWLSSLGQPLLSADSLAQSNSRSTWRRVQILLHISWGKREDHDIFRVLLRHLLLLFSTVLLFHQPSSCSLCFFSFPHSLAPFGVYTHWTKQTPNRCCSLRFPLEWWWWWNTGQMASVNHPAPHTGCLVPRGAQWVTDEWVSEWANKQMNKAWASRGVLPYLFFFSFFFS